jgi:hypothetical protein
MDVGDTGWVFEDERIYRRTDSLGFWKQKIVHKHISQCGCLICLSQVLLLIEIGAERISLINISCLMHSTHFQFVIHALYFAWGNGIQMVELKKTERFWFSEPNVRHAESNHKEE